MSKKRILCVEDAEEICGLISTIFANCEVVTASTAFDALHKAGVEKFDLYLLDHELPDRTGLELTRMIKNFDPETPILFVSGSCSITEEKVINVGAQGLVIKGTTDFIEDLENKVSQALRISATA